MPIYIGPKELGENGDVKASERMIRLASGEGLSDVERVEFDGDVRLTGVRGKV